MLRFYLNLRIGEQWIEDQEGFDLPSVDAARQTSVEETRSLLADDVACGKIDLRGCIEVTDETGSVVATVPFAEPVEVVR